MIKEARHFVESAEVADRCELVDGDFFVSIPSGYDGYLLSRVIHNWNDEQATMLLKSCHSAMHEKSKLLILDQVMLTGEEVGLSVLRLDLQMLLMAVGGQERSIAEYRTLLEDTGFDLIQAIPIQPPYFLIEAAFRRG